MFYKIIVKLKKLFCASSTHPRPSSYPYISGDSFRALATCIYDETKEWQIQHLEHASIIFVKADMLHRFFKEIHPHIRHPYVLISHNSDQNIDDTFFKYIDTKIIHWFAQNNTHHHPKITPIPIGIENAYFCDHGNTSYYRYSPSKNRLNKILFGFNVHTNIERRTVARQSLRQNKHAEEILRKLTTPQYFKHLKSYKFVASPEGNGFDCIRTWEALYCGVIPIVLTSYYADTFIKRGIPILTTVSWDDLQSITEDTYSLTYDTMYRMLDCPALWMDYWIKQIHAKQRHNISRS